MSRWGYFIILFSGFYFIKPVSAQTLVRDSLTTLLKETSNPKARVDILLNLKDLHEDSELNLPYSIELFEEAKKVKDTYALSVAIIPIIRQYATYREKEDSLNYYLSTLQELTQNSPQEGIANYCHLAISFLKITLEIDKNQKKELCLQIVRQLEAHHPPANPYQEADELFLSGIAHFHLSSLKKEPNAYQKQIPKWEKAWTLAQTFPPDVSRLYSNLIYYHLSKAYTQNHEYTKTIEISLTLLQQLEKYYDSELLTRRRPYLYKDNVYVRCYNQLIRGTASFSPDSAFYYYTNFRKKMLSAQGEFLKRNKVYLYENGYLFMADIHRNEESLKLCDTLIQLIETGQAPGYATPLKPYQDKARLLKRNRRYKEACDAYIKAMALSDSLTKLEYSERVEDMRQIHNINRLRLESTQLLARSRYNFFLFSFVILCIALGCSIYYYRNWKKTKKLQQEIARQNSKARESEQMKSIFINSICNELYRPFHAISTYAQKIIKEPLPLDQTKTCQQIIQENTLRFTSILDNLLETANLESLSEDLPTEETDIVLICRQELALISTVPQNKHIQYYHDIPYVSCKVKTHPRYFAFIIRTLLNNARKLTSEGSIKLSCRIDQKNNKIDISITDTGSGIPFEKRKYIFERYSQAGDTIPDMDAGLPICRFIARYLYGDIYLDTHYAQGTSFIFTIPLDPEL